jgi:hypothetical protein
MKLHVITDRPPVRRRFALGPILLQLYRLGVIVLIVLIIRQHHTRLRIDGDAPVRINEVRKFWPEAAALFADTGPRQGLFVRDAGGADIGYVVRTAPQASHIIGYSGPTDTLVAFNPDMTVAGIKLRSSWDTKEHVEDVARDRQFAKLWRKYDWDKLAVMSVEEEGIEGVSGASLTSVAVAEGIVHRVKWAADRATTPPLRWSWIDVGVVIVIGMALAMTFTPLKSHRWARRIMQVTVIGFIGFYAGLLLAQSLLAGWAMSGVAWRNAPGLALLAAAALVLPWATRRQTYCSHLCPHGAAQEWIGRLVPWKLHVRTDVTRALKLLPPGLLAVVLIAVMLNLPLNLAGIEPFDAYLVTAAGWATIIVAIVGLIAAAFIPQAYCRFGCPTGSLLNFVRSHGHADRFSRRDLAAAALLALTFVMWWQYDLLLNLLVPAAQ